MKSFGYKCTGCKQEFESDSPDDQIDAECPKKKCKGKLKRTWSFGLNMQTLRDSH